MPDSPRLLVAFADCAARRIMSPTPWPTSQARQKLTANCWKKSPFMHMHYYISDVNWISQMTSRIQKCLLCCWRISILHSWGAEGGKELPANPQRHSDDSRAHTTRQLSTALGSSQNGFNGADTSEQKEPNRLCVSSCSTTPRDPCSAVSCSKHCSWELTAVIRLRHVKQSHPWISCRRSHQSLRQWHWSENHQVQAVLSGRSQ